MSNHSPIVRATMLAQRTEQWETIRRTLFDVVIIGAGVNGACLFSVLRSAGYRVLLIDKGDFASGSSQASAMMIWGGLPYLRQLDLRAVQELCACRETLIKGWPEWVVPQSFRYVFSPSGNHGESFMAAVLHAYWLLGRCKRLRPRLEPDFLEAEFLNPESVSGSFLYEEGRVRKSDARFVLQWILSETADGCVAFNYCALDGGKFGHSDRVWRLTFRDTLGNGGHGEIRSRLVVNAAGVWVDQINRQFEVRTPYGHVLGKGVFLAFKRVPNHHHVLILDVGVNGNCRSLIPWGPVSLWGPTDTPLERVDEGFRVSPEEVRMLLEELNRYTRRRIDADQIVSLRCGLRPLAVKQGQRWSGSTRDLSRRARICYDSLVPWISIYGGKITGCLWLANSVGRRIQAILGAPRPGRPLRKRPWPMPEQYEFPGLSVSFPSVRWCLEHEMCWTLEDYLRRRTNIAQWVPRGGLGKAGENFQLLKALSREFPTCLGDGEEEALKYKKKVTAEFDNVIGAC